jgi:acetyl-CoA C-acetyltransferase
MALVSCVSGLYTKQGFTIWSRSVPARPYRLLDVTQDVRRAEPLIKVDDYATGEGEIAGCTVLYDKGERTRGIAVVTLDSGARTAAASLDPVVMQRLETHETVGARARVADGIFELI